MLILYLRRSCLYSQAFALFLVVCLAGTLASPLPEDDKSKVPAATATLVDSDKKVEGDKDDLKTAEFWGWGGPWGGWGGWGWGGPWGGWGGPWGGFW